MLEPSDYFQYDKAIRKENQFLFVGRRNEFEEVLDSLLTDTSHCIIYGEAGIGKTSFAWQLLEILEDNYFVLEKLDIKPFLKKDKYLCAWTECVTKPKSINHLLLNVLKYKRDVPNNFRKIFSKAFSQELVLKIENVDVDNYEEVFNIFQEVIDEIKIKYPDKQPVLFIDEFDNLSNKVGIGELLKFISNIKIVIVGIADNINEIIDDHKSSERKLMNSQIELSGLSINEINNLFERAQSKANGMLEYSYEFRNLLTNYSSGFPYLVQLTGFNSIVKYIKSNKEKLVFGMTEFNEIFQKILAFDKNESRYELIKNNIKDFENRQEILFELAKNNSWKSKTDLLSDLDKTYIEGFHNHIVQMIRGKLLKSDELNRIKFVHPIIRAIVRYYSENNLTFIQ
jgi:hypothetical protein